MVDMQSVDMEKVKGVIDSIQINGVDVTKSDSIEVIDTTRDADYVVFGNCKNKFDAAMTIARLERLGYFALVNLAINGYDIVIKIPK